MVGDQNAAAAAPLVILGDKRGLYKALATHGPLTTEERADHTGTTERYVRESCAAQAGSGYIDYELESPTFRMSPEQQAVFADEGCGHGASTLVMAKAFPRSSLIGFDFHAASIQHANEHARESGLDNIRFEVAAAKHLAGQDYDLVTFFDCLHGMGDPIRAAARNGAGGCAGGWIHWFPPVHGDAFQLGLDSNWRENFTCGLPAHAVS
jgi:SAM-dependent methyltransferase